MMSSQVHAGVLYSWHHVAGEPGALPRSMALEIEFSDAAVAAGSVYYKIDDCGWGEFCEPKPDAPVTRFFFGGVTPPIDYAPATRPMDPFAMLTVSVRFEPNGYLSGYIAANDTTSSISLGSSGTLFTVYGISSDMPIGGGCDLWNGECKGARGHLRTLETQPVPEPGSVILFASAALALLMALKMAGQRR